MKAMYKNVTMAGTPQEIAELLQLMDERQAKKIPQPFTWKPNPFITTTGAGTYITNPSFTTNG